MKIVVFILLNILFINTICISQKTKISYSLKKLDSINYQKNYYIHKTVFPILDNITILEINVNQPITTELTIFNINSEIIAASDVLYFSKGKYLIEFSKFDFQSMNLQPDKYLLKIHSKELKMKDHIINEYITYVLIFYL